MSATNQPTVTFPFPTTLGTVPREGSKYATITIDWQATGGWPNGIVPINLLAQFQSGQFTTVQSVIVNNSTNGFGVVLSELESGQTVHVGPFKIGRYPLICGPSPEFTVAALGTSPGGYSGSTQFFFLNTPVANLSESRLEGPALQFSNSLSLNATTPLQINLGIQPTFQASFRSMDLSLVVPGGLSAAANGVISFYEQDTNSPPGHDSSSTVFWTGPWFGAAGVVNGQPIYQRQVLFPGGAVQRFPGNPLWLYTTGTTALFAYLTLTYTILTIQ